MEVEFEDLFAPSDAVVENRTLPKYPRKINRDDSILPTEYQTSFGYPGDIETNLDWALIQTYGGLIDLEVYGTDEEDYAAVAFGAVAFREDECEEPSVEGYVFLLKHDPGLGATHYLFKDIHENAGPYASLCPQRILDRLSPTTNKYALAWRQRCRAELEREDAEPIPAAVE